MSHQALLLLAVEPEERRLQVRVTLEDPHSNPPLDRGFFVRMLITLAREVGGNPHIDAAVLAHHSGPGYESAFIDPNAWRFVSGYDVLLCPEDPKTQETRVFEYEITVVDAAWLDGLSAGLECEDSADFSSGADPITPEEAALVPDIRVGEVLAPFEDRGPGCVSISSDSTLIALMPEMGAVVVVFDSKTLREVLRHPAPLAWECTFVPGSSILVFDADMPAIDVLTGETLPRTEAVAGWKPPATTALPWRAISTDGGVRLIEEELKGRRVYRAVDAEWQTLRSIKRAQEPRLTSDGERIVALHHDTLCVWETRDVDGKPRVLKLRHASTGLALSPDGRFAITMEGRFRHTYVRRISDGEYVRHGASWHDRGEFDQCHPAWSPDGTFIVMGYRARLPGGQGRAEVCRLST